MTKKKVKKPTNIGFKKINTKVPIEMKIFVSVAYITESAYKILQEAVTYLIYQRWFQTL